MANRDTATMLLAELAQSEGIEALTLDDHDYCALLNAEGDVLHLRFEEDRNALLILGTVGALPTEEDLKSVRVMRALLAANLFWLDTLGATLAIENEADLVVLQHSYSLDNANKEQFSVFLKQFSEMLSFWKERYQELGDEVMEDIQPFYLKI